MPVVALCLAVVAAVLLGAPAVVTAGIAVLAAVATYVLGRNAARRGAVPPRLGDVAAALLAAEDEAGIELVAARYMADEIGLGLGWVALLRRHHTETRHTAAPHYREISRLVSAVGEDLQQPYRHPLPSGEGVAAECGAGSGLLLAAASWGPIPDDALHQIDDLATLVGLAWRQLDADSELRSKRAAGRFEELVRYSSDAIFIVDVVGHIRYAAPSITGVLGYLSVDVESRNFADLVPPELRSDAMTFIESVARQDPRKPSFTEIRFSRADGSVIQGEVAGANLLSNRDVHGIVMTVRDVTARHELQQQLHHQAFHDALTGLANRALFHDRLDRAMRVRRLDDDTAPAVAFLDLDDFKTVNDTLGHDAGDALLVAIAERITATLRGSDTAARLGGDEFALLYESVPDDESITDLVQRVVDAVSKPIKIGEDVIEVRTSAGVATRTDPELTADDMLRHADMAMYRAKLRGKAQVAKYETEMHAAANDRLSLTAELDEAIVADELIVHYQPIIDLDSRRVVGLEAFVRWPHRSRGDLMPGDFIEMAEATGLIVPLGVNVMRRALVDLARLRSDGFQHLRMAINVSSREIRDERFLLEVGNALRSSDVPPANVVFEFAETTFRSDDDILQSRVRELHDLGCGIALDDFGTGHSSLTDLQALRFHHLKIDRAFVSPLRNGDETALAGTIIDLAETLGAVAVAEGIETEVELSRLQALGCRLGQGNYFGAPASFDALLPMLVAEGKRVRTPDQITGV